LREDHALHDRRHHIELEMDELRAIAAYAADCAERALPIYEAAVPGDPRPRAAIDAAREFGDGGRRTRALRTRAMAAFRAAREAPTPAAEQAAHAASAAAGAAYLHPLASADQVKHILGSAAHAARALELDAAADEAIGAEAAELAVQRAPAAVATVLARYPRAPARGGRRGELLRHIDERLRSRSNVDRAR
jgi:hypothetical protein